MSGAALLAITALVLGWIAGQRYERAARGWRDYRARRAELPLLRAVARLLTAKAAGAVAFAVAFAGFALCVVDHPRLTRPPTRVRSVLSSRRGRTSWR